MNQQKDQNPIVEQLVHAACDYTVRNTPEKRLPDIPSLIEKSQSLIQTLNLDESSQHDLFVRLQAYNRQGKDLRRESGINQTPTATLLHQTSSEVEELLHILLAADPGAIREQTRLAFAKLFDRQQTQALDVALQQSDAQLYQEVMGVSFDECKQALGMTKAEKWIDLIRPVFVERKALTLLEHLGCIPQELYTAKKFQGTVQFSHLAQLNAQLKGKEEKTKGPERRRILHASAQLLQQLFLSGLGKKEAEGTVTIDVNGLWINLQKPAGKGKELHRINRHLPYSYAADDVLRAMIEQGWISEADAFEGRLRREEDTHNVLEAAKLEEEKVRRYAQELGVEKIDVPLEELYEAIRDKLFLTPLNEKQKNGHVPLSLIRHDLTHVSKYAWANHYPLRLRIALGQAEGIQHSIAGEMKQGSGYESYTIAEAAEENYKMRTRILHNPRNYDAARIAGLALEHHADVTEVGAEKGYHLFRGTIHGKNKDKNHGFLEIILSDGFMQRVLLDPKKQLTEEQRVLYEQLPELNEREYQCFETFALSHQHIKRILLFMKESERRCSDWNVDFTEGWKEFIREMNGFLLMEYPERYAESQQYVHKFEEDFREKEGKNVHLDWNYVSICEYAIGDFEQKLFSSRNPKDIVQPFLTRLHTQSVIFDDDYLATLLERFTNNHHHWNEELCRQLRDISHSVTVVQAEDRKIPYYMEARAIDALKIPRDRPLISLVGGCRQYATGGKQELANQLCSSLVHAAEALHANVSIPGTQSGIGNTISRVAVMAQQQTSQLPVTQRANFFAISPGKETFYPGNTIVASPDEQRMSVYAMAPVNTILTPFSAGWSYKGRKKRSAQYFEHLTYAEAVYNRLSADQARVTVVSNGGLFTIADTNTALRNHSAVLLVEDTGRFADLAIALESERNALIGLSQPEWEVAVLNIIRTCVPDHSRSRLLEEFGMDTDIVDIDKQEEQKLYREQLWEYFHLCKGNTIQATNVDNLENTLESVVAAEKAKKDQKKR